MSQAGIPSGYRSPGMDVPRTNGIALAGFIVSLVGLVVTGGLLCPVGVLLSLIGMMKPPRAFAVAGLVVGLVGTLVGAALVWFVIYSIMLSQAFASTWTAPTYQAEQQITYHTSMTGNLPDEATGNNLVKHQFDEWGTPYRYKPVGAKDFELISAGPDMQHGTADDLITTHTAYLGSLHGQHTTQPYAPESDPAFARADAVLQAHYTGTPLTDAQGQAAIAGITDRFGTELRYRTTFDNNYFLRSAGPDRQWDTEDDPDPYVGTMVAE